MSSSAASKAALLSHPLLVAVRCPPSGNGALLYLRNLLEGLRACATLEWGVSVQSWLTFAQELRDALQHAEPKSLGSPTEAECQNSIWGDLHACLSARARVRSHSTRHIDATLALYVLDAASGNRQLTTVTIQGLKNCYTAIGGSGRVHEDWLLFSSGLPEGSTDLESCVAGIKHQAARVFAQGLISLRKQPMPTPAGMEPQITVLAPTPEERNNASPTACAAEPDTVDLDFSESAESEHTDGARENQSVFKRGDSILQWHIKHAEYASRNDRLALDSWTSLPPVETCRVASRLLPILSDKLSPYHRGAVIAALSLLTSTPGHVLLHGKTNCSEDLCVDLEQKQIRWRLPIEKGDMGQTGSFQRANTVVLPLPLSVADALHDLLNSRDPHEIDHLSDLFDVRPETAGWDSLLKQTYDLLMEVSDPAFPAYPGRWSNSMSRVFIEECGSDLMASICSFDLTVVPSSALYYFHPSAADIHRVSEQIHSRLGLGPTAAMATMAATECQRGVPSDQELIFGFTKITLHAQELLRSIQGTKTSLGQAIKDLNELTRLTAAMCVFLIGGRGSRIETITRGALHCHQDYWWLEDKRVDHESSSRIVPKSVHTRHWLRQLHTAQVTVSERLISHIDRNVADRWKELAGGLLRFDAPAFEFLHLNNKKVKRTAVSAADVEAVAQFYFGSRKNFMRHVLITRWGCSGKDRHLLRLLTGHATAGLAMPAAGAMYSPQSAVLETGRILEELLSSWLPKLTDKLRHKDVYNFVRLPGGRIHKAHKAHRSHIDQWDSMVPSQLHLASERIVDRVRELLLNGQGPSQPLAHLWLHVVSFDALHEAADLASIFADPAAAFKPGADDWTVKFSRMPSLHPLITKTQTPTSLLLTRLDGIAELQPTKYEEVLDEAGKWLALVMPDTWRGSKTRAEEAFLACCSLWADWRLPPALQLCYSANSHAPVLDERSTAELLGLPKLPYIERSPNSHRMKPLSGDLFGTFYKVINNLGTSGIKLGEQKKRAQLFDRWQLMYKIPTEGELACTLIRVVQVNSSRIRAGKKNAIKFSSLSTYLSGLRPFLESTKHISLDALDPLDWLEFCVDLKEFSDANEREKATTREAALWLISCLAELEYPTPDLSQTTSIPRHPVATKATQIPSLKPDQLEKAETILNAIRETALQRKRLLAAFSLLKEAPLRWGEVATLSSKDFTFRSELCVTSHGYAQLKSKAARRRQGINDQINTQLRTIAQSVQKLQKNKETAALIFGSKHLADNTEAADSDWIRVAITNAIHISSGNTLFRIHNFRAHNVSMELCPQWMLATRWDNTDPIGPSDLQYFQYDLSRAWVTDQSKLRAGHASIRTTLSFYFHAWLPVRAMALKATLTRHHPSEYQLTALDLSKGALEKACSREDTLRADPWKYVQRKLSERLLKKRKINIEHPVAIDTEQKPLQQPTKSNDSVESTNEIIPTNTKNDLEKHFIWLGLRMLGFDREEADNSDHAPSISEIETLEKKLALSSWSAESLRGRIKGKIYGRSLGADKRQLLAPQTYSLIQTVSQLPLELVMKLLVLLQSNHEITSWDVDIEDIAPYFEKTDYCLEIVWDIKRTDAEKNLRLSRSNAILIGSPAHDVGRYPRIFVQPRLATARNTVVKARLTTLVRVLCNCRHVLAQPFPSN